MAATNSTKTANVAATAEPKTPATPAEAVPNAAEATETPATPSPTQAELDAIREGALGKRRRDVKAAKSAGYETR